MSLHEKMAMPDLLKYPLNHNEKKTNVEDTIVFLTRKVFISQMKINSLKEQKDWYLIHTWSDKAFKGTIVNQTLSSLHGGSLEITLTCYSVPLRWTFNLIKML